MTLTWKPKNPELYDALVQAAKIGLQQHRGLSGHRIQVHDAGSDMRGQYQVNALDPRCRMKLNITSYGESYGVCCPGCGDSRHRLWISHRFNTYDPVLKYRTKRLLKCFNENCQTSADFADAFLARIDPLGTMLHRALPVRDTVTNPGFALSDAVALPDGCVSLGDLPAGHPCLKFLESRFYHAKRLDKYFQLRWCTHSASVPGASQRLVVPFFREGQIVGWQARYVNQDGSGDCARLFRCGNSACKNQWQALTESKACPVCQAENSQKIVKWLTAPGSKASLLLYNMDYARTFQFGVVVEGPADVWRVGTPTMSNVPGPAVASFGHKLSDAQLLLLRNTFGQRGPVFLMYDDDVYKETILQFQKYASYFPRGLVPVVLPANTDPGDISHSQCWELLEASAQACNVPRPW